MRWVSMAPAVRATSEPPRKSARVGMLRIPSRPASPWFSSVLTFTSRTRGSSSRAAASKAGAIIRQGPHQGAQKSTRSGTSLRPRCRANRCSSRGTGDPL